MKTPHYLDALKKRLNLTADYQLAVPLGVDRASVSNYRSGKRSFDNEQAFIVAELLTVDARQVIADMELERAQRAHNKPKIELWRRWAAGFVLTFGAATLGATIAPGSAEARTLHNQNLGPEYTYGPNRRNRRFLGVSL